MTKPKRANEEKEPWEEDDAQDFGGHPNCFELQEGNDGRLQRPFDLEERTARFGEAVIKFSKKIPRGPVNNRIIDQLVGSGTSVGANYCEADEAVSKKEFINKIGTCKKEAKESKHFIRMAAVAEPCLKDEARVLWREAKE